LIFRIGGSLFGCYRGCVLWFGVVGFGSGGVVVAGSLRRTLARRRCCCCCSFGMVVWGMCPIHIVVVVVVVPSFAVVCHANPRIPVVEAFVHTVIVVVIVVVVVHH